MAVVRRRRQGGVSGPRPSEPSQITSAKGSHRAGPVPGPRYCFWLLVLDVIISALAVWLIVEAICALGRAQAARLKGPAAGDAASDEARAEGVGRISLGSTQWRAPQLLHNR